MPDPGGTPPPAGLRARALRVEHRPGRLVVWSGLRGLVVLLCVLPVPAAMLFLAIERGPRDVESLPPLLLGLAWLAGAWTLGGSWTLTLDRGTGWATLRRGPWRTRRRLDGFVGVRAGSMLQAQIERVRRRQVVMPYAPFPDLGAGVVLVDRGGRWWRVTRSQDKAYARPAPRFEDAVAAARLVADHLDLPLLPPYETPPGGAVPPPLDGQAWPPPVAR